MADAEEPDNEAEPAPKPLPVPDEAPEQAPPGEILAEVADDGDPQEPEEPQEPIEPHLTVLQGFRTIGQTLSAAYRDASSEVQKVIRWALRTSTADDRTFIWGTSNTIHHWVASIRPAIAGTEMGKDTKDHSQLLANAREAGKEAIDSVLGLIPDEEPRLTLV